MTFRPDEGRQGTIAPSIPSLARGPGQSTPDRSQPQPSGKYRSARLHSREDGQTTVVMALFLGTFLFGFIALGIDVEYLFHAKRMAQAAADAAAIAAAEQYLTNGLPSAQTAANAMAKLNGFDTTLASNPATVTLNVPPTSGSYKSASSTTTYVETIVSQPIPTFFMQVLNHKTTVTVSARAVAAAGQTSPTCVCLEGTSGMDLNMSNDSKVSTSGCGTTVNSTSNNAVGVVGGNGKSISLSGISLGIAATGWTYADNVTNSGSIDPKTIIVTGIKTTCSPPLPKVPSIDYSKCMGDPLHGGAYGNGATTYAVGPLADPKYTKTQSTSDGNLVCYNALDVGENWDTVTLNPGIYVINGGQLHFASGANNASNLGGNGVFFYLVGNASLAIDNGANVNLTAPTSGTYNGIVVFQDPLDIQKMNIAGGSNTSFNGAIYAPASDVTMNNGANTAIDADLVAKTLTMGGGGVLSSSAAANMGSMNLSVSKVTE